MFKTEKYWWWVIIILYFPQYHIAFSVHWPKPRTRGVRYLLHSSLESFDFPILKNFKESDLLKKASLESVPPWLLIKWFQTKKYQWKCNWNIHKKTLSTSALLDKTWSRKTSNQFRKTTHLPNWKLQIFDFDLSSHISPPFIINWHQWKVSAILVVAGHM